jgi:hypothetical protein
MKKLYLIYESAKILSWWAWATLCAKILGSSELKRRLILVSSTYSPVRSHWPQYTAL